MRDQLLGVSLAYRAIQAPFADQKLAPFLADANVQRATSVLDVGCGPGTNTRHFAHTSYVGVDLSDSYVRDARRQHGRNFLAADVSRTFLRNTTFDCILSNSLLHHLDDTAVQRTLTNLGELLAPDGHVYILDLVLPDTWNVAKALARADRGDFPRPLRVWRELFSPFFEPVACFPYPVGVLGLTLRNMVYFKGRPKR